MRVALHDTCRCEGGAWSLPVGLDGDPPGAPAGLVTVTLLLRGDPTEDGLRYTWAEHPVLSAGVSVVTRVEDAENGHTTVTGHITIAWAGPGGLDVDEAALLDEHDRRWDVIATTIRPGMLELQLHRFERVIERGDRAWA